jgi:hypothetical protein
MYFFCLPTDWSLNRLLAIVLISSFAVLSHWGVWSNGVFSLGLNTSLVWLALGALLIHANDRIDFSYDWLWLLPLALLAISFALYENPWLKLVSVLVMPVGIGVFFGFAQLTGKRQQLWRAATVAKLIANTLSVLPAIPASMNSIRMAFSARLDSSNLGVFKRILRAVAILVPLMFIVLMLLSSADDNFEAMVSAWFSTLTTLLDWSTAAKIICVFIFSSVLLAVNNTLAREVLLESQIQPRQVDDVIASIVLFTILIVYIAFLSLQLDYLIVDKLPIEFSATERLVKSGFWQLFFLSVINIGLFYWVYQNTGLIAQWILRLYLIASALILLSAAWRMGMYVFYYGFSYEKFFASYTTLYALGLFCFLGWAVFSASRKDIIKTLCLSFLWMFSIVNILPVERIIFHSNISLSQYPSSRIDLFHLSELSVDILAEVNTALNDRRLLNTNAWINWQRNKIDGDCERPWFESNLSLEVNCLATDISQLPESHWRSY